MAFDSVIHLPGIYPSSQRCKVWYIKREREQNNLHTQQ